MSGEPSTQLSFGSYSGRLCAGAVLRDVGRRDADHALHIILFFSYFIPQFYHSVFVSGHVF